MAQQHPWIEYYPEGIAWDAEIPVQPLYTILEEAAADFPDKVALDFMGRETRYAQLQRQVDAVAGALQGLGVQKGTKVGLFLPNCPQQIISYFAVLKAGGVVVNLSPLYPVGELQGQCKDAGVEMIVTLNLKQLYPKVEALVKPLKLKRVIVGTLPEVLPAIKGVLFKLFKGRETVSFPDDAVHRPFSVLLDHDPIRDVPKIDPKRDVAVLQYTGGTTGTPKGAKLSHANLLANAEQCALWASADPRGQGRMLAVLPFFHVFAMTVAMNFAIRTAATIILHPRFELKQVLKDIHRKKPTHLPGVPTMYTALANSPEVVKYDLTSLKCCISGGAPLPAEVKQQFEDMTGCVLLEGYGLTEASPVVSCNPLQGENRSGTIGLPFPQTEVAVEDMETRGEFLPIGKRGELCVRGPQVMLGYHNRLSETEEVLTPEGWLRTGDIATLDEDGFIRIVDRRKELILSGGFNVYPRHVEEAIYTHGAVLEAAAVGEPDDYRGERVVVYVALKEGERLTKPQLMEHLKEHLGRHEMPAKIHFRKSLPKTMIGKISKKDLV